MPEIKRVTIKVEFDDGAVQEFTAEEPRSAALDVRPQPPDPFRHPGLPLDLSRIPVNGVGATIDLKLVLGPR